MIYRLITIYSLLVLNSVSQAQGYTPEKTAGCIKPSGNTYTKCNVVPNAGQDASNSNAYCLPETGGTGPQISSFSVQKLSSEPFAVANIAVKNCRTATGTVAGDFVIVVDNSSSTCNSSQKGTDCGGARGVFAKSIINEVANGTNKIGVISYGGREGATTDPQTYTNDPTNKLDPDMTKISCHNTDSGWSGEFPPYSVSRSPEPWRSADNAGNLLSRCEFIPINTTKTLAESFIDFTVPVPRGATDFTYFLEAAHRTTGGLLGSSASGSKNLIVITDGLPNIPKRIPRAECEKSQVLMAAVTESGGAFYKDENNREYCYDRQFKRAAEIANKYTEGIIDFSGNPDSSRNRFSEINTYNVLFVGDGLAYSDIDYTTGERLYPDDFLIENSSRSGNGKVKYAYIRGAQAEAQKAELLSNLRTHSDAHALQRVTVTVNGTTYNAVSNGVFDTKFDIKLIGLVSGNNTVKIDAFYADNAIPSTTANFVVTVNDVNAVTQTSCASADMSKTVDGDDPSNTAPKGDGVLPYPNSDNTQCRVFRNADSSNTRDFSSFYTQNYGETLRQKAARLRIQGGTGNCGTIAGMAGSSAFAALLLFLMPFIYVLFRRKL